MITKRNFRLDGNYVLRRWQSTKVLSFENLATEKVLTLHLLVYFYEVYTSLVVRKSLTLSGALDYQ